MVAAAAAPAAAAAAKAAATAVAAAEMAHKVLYDRVIELEVLCQIPDRLEHVLALRTELVLWCNAKQDSDAGWCQSRESTWDNH